MKKLIQNIFSIKKEDGRKIIRILGIKIKLKKEKYLFSTKAYKINEKNSLDKYYLKLCGFKILRDRENISYTEVEHENFV